MNFKLLTKELRCNEDPESPVVEKNKGPVVKKIKAASQLSWSEILLSLPLQLSSHAPVFFSMKEHRVWSAQIWYTCTAAGLT